MFNDFVIIGVGTLGGFLAEALARLDDTEKITCIDHDIVERKNVKNSIYRHIDVGFSKTRALREIITNNYPGVTVNAVDLPFSEEHIPVPPSDLVFDCRDYICNRGDKIDVRISISSRYVIVDCRKNVKYLEEIEGKYLIELNKDDIRHAAFIVSMLVSNKAISQLIKSKAVQKYELDYLKRIEPKYGEIVYECDDQKFLNLPSNIMPIIEANHKKDLEVFVGSREYPISKARIPRDTIRSSSDVVVNLNSVINFQCEYSNFIISISPTGYIELIPETGAA
jgi:hypothetical protein